MAQFEAEVCLYESSEVDALAARRAIEEKLRNAGFERWKILSIGPPRPASRPRPARPGQRPARNGVGHARADAGQGAWVVVAAVAWAIWFVWLLSG